MFKLGGQRNCELCRIIFTAVIQARNKSYGMARTGQHPALMLLYVGGMMNCVVYGMSAAHVEVFPSIHIVSRYQLAFKARANVHV